jgi:hypothetical protein
MSARASTTTGGGVNMAMPKQSILLVGFERTLERCAVIELLRGLLVRSVQ